MDTNSYYYNAMPPQPEAPKKEQNKFFKKLMTAILLAIVFGAVAGGTFYGMSNYFGEAAQTDSDNTTVIYQTEEDGLIASTGTASEETGVESIVESVMPAMVAITNTTEMQYHGFFGTQTETNDSCGTGIIIGQSEELLYIVTNNHVIEDADKITVTFNDNESVEASVKGTDSTRDLAVIIVEKSEMESSTLNAIKVAVLGNSDDLKLGQSVVAIGNALGYGQTVTTGVVSALDRAVVIDDMTASLLQTSAAINPGNSGGALLNMKGEVIGINSAKYSDTDVEGVGFAIPITDAKPVIENLISKDMISEDERGYMGIYGTDVTESVSSVYNLPIGVYVSQLVSGGAAQKAGIRAGDVIVKVAGNDVESMSELHNILQYYRYGEEIEVVVKTLTDGEYIEKTVTVKLQRGTSR